MWCGWHEGHSDDIFFRKDLFQQDVAKIYFACITKSSIDIKGEVDFSVLIRYQVHKDPLLKVIQTKS